MKTHWIPILMMCLSLTQAASVRFAVISNVHYAKKTPPEEQTALRARLDKLFNTLKAEKPDFIFSVGELSNGHGNYEIQDAMALFRTTGIPFRNAIGGIDLYPYPTNELARLLDMPSSYYDFTVNNFRFIVLDAYEQSSFCREGTPEKAAYKAFKEANQHVDWANNLGVMSNRQWQWLSSTLEKAKAANEQVILFSHVPSWTGSDSLGFSKPRIPDYRKLLDLLDNYPNVRAYIAGKQPRGGIAVRNGVLYKTVKDFTTNGEPTACLFEASDDQIRVIPIGQENAFLHRYDMEDATISGTAPAGCWVMTNLGDIMQVGPDGKFSFTVPCRGIYAIKAVQENCADCYLPMIQAPADNLKVEFTPDPGRKLYTGDTNGYATLRIQEDGQPVHFFDLAGTPYGSLKRPGQWCERNTNYWSKGRYAFTSKGQVTISTEPRHPQIKQLGWYRGDLHAHLIHGENFYRCNAQMFGFIGRAEGYDWLYAATSHGNDGYPTDVIRLAHKLSGPDFFYKMNQEYPKWKSNHFGNTGVEPVLPNADMTRMSSLEQATRFVWESGGLTIPVHPFYDHMACRQLCLWILCAPEKLPLIDFYYFSGFNKRFTENYWFMLLNRGYEIGCAATSDAAFDVGRTPGHHRGSNYLKLERLTEDNIQKAIMGRKAIVSYEGAFILPTIGDATCGDHLPADNQKRTLALSVCWRKGARGNLRVIRNGADIHQQALVFSSDDDFQSISIPIQENENAWYVAIMEKHGKNPQTVSATSPIFFRNQDFKAPEAIPIPRLSPEFLAEFQELTPEKLSETATLDYFADKLRKLNQEQKR